MRLLGDGFNGFTGSVAKHVRDEAHAFDAFCALASELETHSGRRAFVDALASETFPELKRNAWATERDGLRTLVRWMEQITTKESGAALAARCIALLLKLPVDLSAIRASGAARVMQKRFATHPEPEVLRLLARKRARVDARRAPRKGGGARRRRRRRRAFDADLRRADLGRTYASRGRRVSPPTHLHWRWLWLKKQTVDEMIASADGLAEGGAAAEAARAAKAAEAALAAATSRARGGSGAFGGGCGGGGRGALRDAWSAGSTKKNAFKQRSFEEFEAHKKRKREHKKREKSGANARMPPRRRRMRARAPGPPRRHRAPPRLRRRARDGRRPRASRRRASRDPKACFEVRARALAEVGRGEEDGQGEARRRLREDGGEGLRKLNLGGRGGAAGGGDAVANFLTQQRKSKIKKMLDAYVAR